MKLFFFFLAAALSAPTITGTPHPSTTRHVESLDVASTTSTSHPTDVDIDDALSRALIMLLSERNATNTTTTTTPSTLQARQSGPLDVYWPPPGTKWSWRTRCVISSSARHLPIWRILKQCKIRHNGDPRGNTRIYELCAMQADEQGISEEEKYMRCERFKGFGK